MTNKTKRDIAFFIVFILTAMFLTIISNKTNWFHYSGTVYTVAFCTGMCFQYIMCDLGWEDEEE